MKLDKIIISTDSNYQITQVNTFISSNEIARFNEFNYNINFNSLDILDLNRISPNLERYDINSYFENKIIGSKYISSFNYDIGTEMYLAVNGKINLIDDKKLKIITNLNSKFIEDKLKEGQNINEEFIDQVLMYHRQIFDFDLEEEKEFEDSANKFEELYERKRRFMELENIILETNGLEVIRCNGTNSNNKNLKKSNLKVINNK